MEEGLMSTADVGGRCCDGHLRLAGSPAGRRSILVTTLVFKDIEQYGLEEGRYLRGASNAAEATHSEP